MTRAAPLEELLTRDEGSIIVEALLSTGNSGDSGAAGLTATSRAARAAIHSRVRQLTLSEEGVPEAGDSESHHLKLELPKLTCLRLKRLPCAPSGGSLLGRLLMSAPQLFARLSRLDLSAAAGIDAKPLAAALASAPCLRTLSLPPPLGAPSPPVDGHALVETIWCVCVCGGGAWVGVVRVCMCVRVLDSMCDTYFCKAPLHVMHTTRTHIRMLDRAQCWCTPPAGAFWRRFIR